MRVIRTFDQVTKKWSGGTTTELAIAPAGAVYAERNFLWRLSTAEVLEEESIFTELSDYHRLLTLRRGSLRLQHDGGEWYDLEEGQIASFDGASLTRSRGKVTDFNLMLRKGRAEGELHAARHRFADPEEVLLTALFPKLGAVSENEIRGIYLAAGKELILRDHSVKIPLHAGELVLWDRADSAAASGIWAEGDGELLLIYIVIREIV